MRNHKDLEHKRVMLGLSVEEAVKIAENLTFVTSGFRYQKDSSWANERFLNCETSGEPHAKQYITALREAYFQALEAIENSTDPRALKDTNLRVVQTSGLTVVVNNIGTIAHITQDGKLYGAIKEGITYQELDFISKLMYQLKALSSKDNEKALAIIDARISSAEKVLGNLKKEKEKLCGPMVGKDTARWA